MTKTEKLRNRIIDVSPCPIPNNTGEGFCPKGVTHCRDCALALSEAHKVLFVLKEAGLLFVSDNYKTPRYEDYYPTTTFTPRFQQSRMAAWSKGQLRMLSDGFKKTEPIEIE